MAWWKVALKGKGAAPIQGVGLRELVNGLAHNTPVPVKGKIMNKKGSAEVELVCEFDAKDSLESFLQKVKTVAKSELGVEIEWGEPIESSDMGTFLAIKDFEIVREDDLKEMVWALQGAGRRFEQLAKLLKKQDTQSELYKLNGLAFCLDNLAEHYKQHSESGHSRHNCPSREALDSFLREPFDDNLFATLKELDSLLRDLNENMQASRAGNAGQTDKLMKLFDKTLKAIEVAAVKRGGGNLK